MADPVIMIALGAVALFILCHLIHAAATFNIKAVGMHPWRMIGLASWWSLAGAGSVAVALGAGLGGPMLLLAVACLLASERRVR